MFYAGFLSEPGFFYFSLDQDLLSLFSYGPGPAVFTLEQDIWVLGISFLYLFLDLLLASGPSVLTCFLELLAAIAAFYQRCSLSVIGGLPLRYFVSRLLVVLPRGVSAPIPPLGLILPLTHALVAGAFVIFHRGVPRFLTGVVMATVILITLSLGDEVLVSGSLILLLSLLDDLGPLPGSFYTCVLPLYIMRSVATGIIIATPICALGYLFVPWYHDYLISGWHSPSTWMIGIPVGIAVAILTDGCLGPLPGSFITGVLYELYLMYGVTPSIDIAPLYALYVEHCSTDSRYTSGERVVSIADLLDRLQDDEWDRGPTTPNLYRDLYSDVDTAAFVAALIDAR